MLKKRQSYYLKILDNIEDIYEKKEFEKSSVMLLTSLYSGGVSEKDIISGDNLSSLEFNLSTELVKYISKMIDSRKSVGYISLKDPLGIEVDYIIEAIHLSNSIIILGAGHVGRSLSLIASILGFEVTLVDDRKEFLSDSEIVKYNINRVYSPFDNYSDSILISPNCAIVIVTRGHQHDEICLRSAISTKAKYIGMIGSKRRVLAIKSSIKGTNLSVEQERKLDSIFAPIGLEIGAKSPQEIAVSILAQIIKVIN
jgi:xanthine dehydrogenase accessory factor